MTRPLIAVHVGGPAPAGTKTDCPPDCQDCIEPVDPNIAACDVCGKVRHCGNSFYYHGIETYACSECRL